VEKVCDSNFVFLLLGISLGFAGGIFLMDLLRRLENKI